MAESSDFLKMIDNGLTLSDISMSVSGIPE